MDYFFEPELMKGIEPLDSGIIKSIEDFYFQNLKVIIKQEYSNEPENQIIECAFTAYMESE